MGIKQCSSQDDDSFTFKKGDHQIGVTCTNGLWTIEDNAFSKSITLCPVATWHSESLEGVRTTDNITIPCVLFNAQQPNHPSLWLELEGSHRGAMQLSPLDFYVEERLISLFGAWLILNNACSYGKDIPQLSQDSLRVAGGITGISINHSTHTMQILQPLAEEDKAELADALKKDNLCHAENEFDIQSQALDELSGCPVCGSKARFTPRDGKSFKSECLNNSCKLTVAIQKEAGERYLLLTTDDPEHESFEESGRWCQKSRLDRK